MKLPQLLQLFTLAALWGASFLFIRLAVPHFGVVPLTAVRSVVATITLMPILLLKGKWPELRAALGLLGFSGDRDKMVRIPAIDFDDENNVRLTVRTVGSLSGTAQEAMIKDLIHSRMIARQAKKFDVADQIRDELAAMGIELKDAKDPKTGELVTTWEVAR